MLTSSSHKRIPEFLAFICVLALFVLQRLFVYIHLNMQYFDSDQPLMWLAAREYSEGVFHEPRYYGQDYNTMLEGLFAAPFLWMKIPVYYAVPFATHILFAVPWFVTALYLLRKGLTTAAILTLAIPVCLPTEFHMLTSLPRGFVCGLFFCSFFVVSVIRPLSLSWLHINSALAVVAFFVNQNSLVLSVPLLVFLFIKNRKNARAYWCLITFIVTAVLMYLLLDKFYRDHPDYVLVHLNLKFSLAQLWENLCDLDSRFAHLSFFKAKKSWILLSAIAVLLGLLYRKSKAAFVAVASGLFIVVTSFCFEKNIEGTSWPFFSFSRSYLGLISLLALFVPLIVPYQARWTVLLAMVPVIAGAYFAIKSRRNIESYIGPKQNYYVTVFKIPEALNAIEFYKNKCSENKARLFFVSRRFWMNSLLVYGGPAIHSDYPLVMEAEKDRRYWMNDEANNILNGSFIFISPLYDLDKEIKREPCYFDMKRLDDYGLYLINNFDCRVEDFMKFVRKVEVKSE